MKNKVLIKKIIRLADKLEILGKLELAYRGYQLAGILNNNYDGDVSNIIALCYSEWLSNVKSYTNIYEKM